MTTGNRIFVVAATVQAFNDRKRLLPESSRSDYGIIPVLNDADMRGRSIMVGDLVLVCGDWSNVPHDRIQRIVGMFNSRRDVSRDAHEIPLLRWQPGEAPEVGYPNPPGPMSRENYPVLTTHTATTNTINTTDPVVVQTLNGNQYTFGIETTIPPQGSSGSQQSSHTDAEVQELVQELEDARALIKVNDKLVTAMSEQYQQLASWLSGVQPVEDPEIPGLLYCGVCGTNLQRGHTDGCPAAAPR